MKRLILPSIALTALAWTSSASATVSEQASLVTFRLDDPTAVRLHLLDAFHNVAVDPTSGVRHYLASPRGRFWSEPWASFTSLAWRTITAEESLSSIGPNEEARASASISPDGVAGAFHAGAPLGLEGGSLAGYSFADNPSPSTPLVFPSAAAPAWIDPSFVTPVYRTPTGVFAHDGFNALWSLPPAKPVYNWRCRRRPIAVSRYGGEVDHFALVRCDNSAAPEALDRLTLMARVPETRRPGELLPEDPDPTALKRGEWIAGVRLVHPRLLWVLQRVADAFPWRTVYIYSGYRPNPDGRPLRPNTHHSMHAEARALDIAVVGIPNASLFQVCRTLDDVGCGYYPNSAFVHMDVRQAGTGRAYWVDISGPGEPAHYVDSWPGVVDRGALVWDSAGRFRGESSPAADASCTVRTGP